MNRALCLGILAAAAYSQPRAPSNPELGGCPVFPSNNVWNTRVDTLPVHPRSDDFVRSIGIWKRLHPDFGSGNYRGSPIGIPFVIVPENQPVVHVTMRAASESDPGPYPIPPDVPIEGGPLHTGDRHVLVLQSGKCRLYELLGAYPKPDGSWNAFSGAIFDLRSNALRPAGWTSADAAGFAILPGLVRYDEIAAGEIRHALRFTAPYTADHYVWPARHRASVRTTPDPPMGQRFRLKAGVDISGFPPDIRVLLRALKTYGMMLADHGGPWYLSGAPDRRWNNARITLLMRLRGADFEAVDSRPLQKHPGSAEARQNSR